MGGVFISYRRSDSEGHAGRLYDRLKDRFGAEQVFRDIDKIEPGSNFIDVLNRALGSCSVLLAVIGKTWLTTTDATQRRRLDDPGDLTRLEIKTALERGIRVIPVLVQGAAMGSPQELPEDLRNLSYIQALELSTNRWDYDVDLLVKSIEKEFGAQPKSDSELSGAKKQPSDATTSSTRKLIIGAVAVGILGVGIVIKLQGNNPDETRTVSPQNKIESALSDKPANKTAAPATNPKERIEVPVTPGKAVPAMAKKVLQARYTVSLSEDRSTMILAKGSGDEKHISLDPDRVQKIYTAPGGGWCLAVFKVRGQPLYGALPINLTRGAEGASEELSTLPEQVTFVGNEAVVKLSGGETRRIHLN